MLVEIRIFGVIQGVGFRPFIYKMMNDLHKIGFVRNDSNCVVIVLKSDDIENLIKKIRKNAPQNAIITRITHKIITDKKIIKNIESKLKNSFFIEESSISSPQTPYLPTDLAICKDCLAEIKNKNSRFFNYPFTTCTNCGPRYSILKHLPYDRANTSMATFQMCNQCKNEYENPLDRRFHAQPHSCKNCGIKLIDYENVKLDSMQILKNIAKLIKMGKIIALKGIGGFNLIADASNFNAIMELRKRKNRPHKPFAVMFKSLADIKNIAFCNNAESKALLSKEAPIVLLQKKYKKNSILDAKCLEALTPNISTIGAILPYSGMLHLLFNFLDKPIIFTSANISGEPIITNFKDLQGLSGVFDKAFDYDREIYNAIDDSVVRFIAKRIRILRFGRGFAPKVLQTRQDSSNFIKALGAQQKSTITLLKEKNALISSYIGDLDNKKSIDYFQKTMNFLEHFYDNKNAKLTCDLHPLYTTTQLAKTHNPLQLQHHKAHFYSALFESKNLHKKQRNLGIIFDGTGFGEDGCIWGGEAFIFENKNMERVCHFEYFKLLGGESAIKDIKKTALSLLWQYGLDLAEFESSDSALLKAAFKKGANAPLTSSVGRLFDGVAYILKLLDRQTYEGQSGAIIESNALKNKKITDSYKFSIENKKIHLENIIKGIYCDRFNAPLASAKFINTLANIALQLARIHNAKCVYFSGGVFANKLLCDKIASLFHKHHILFFMHQILPCNDSNISLGQGIYAQGELCKQLAEQIG